VLGPTARIVWVVVVALSLGAGGYEVGRATGHRKRSLYMSW
jgi:hypothetical protein